MQTNYFNYLCIVIRTEAQSGSKRFDGRRESFMLILLSQLSSEDHLSEHNLSNKS